MHIKRIAIIVACLIITVCISYSVSTYDAAYTTVPANLKIADDSRSLIGFSSDIIGHEEYVPIFIDDKGNILDQEIKIPFTIYNNLKIPIHANFEVFSEFGNTFSLSELDITLSPDEQKEVILSLDTITYPDFSADLIIKVQSSYMKCVIEKTIKFKGEIKT